MAVVVKLLILAVALTGAGCQAVDRASVPPTIVKTVEARTGLTADERARFYHLEEGSEVFPVSWFLALEDERGAGLFAERLDRFGFIPDGKGPANPFGLPVGLTAARTRDLKQFADDMLGINCAACHVREATYKGNRLRLDGAPARLDASAFYQSLASSVLRTLDLSKDIESLLRFMKRRAAGTNPLLTNEESTRAFRFQTALPESPEPADSFSQQYKDQLRRMLLEEERAAPIDLNEGVMLKRAASAFTGPGLAERLRGDLSPQKLSRVVPRRATPSTTAMAQSGSPAQLRSGLIDFAKDALTTYRLLKARAKFLIDLTRNDGSKDVAPGFGRLDAFGGARNILWGDKGIMPQTAPVSYPDLWSFNTLEWVHWDGNTTSVLERNIGQALGLGAVLDRTSMASTVSVINLHELELLAMKISPPRWDEAVLGAIDRDKAARGKVHFDKECAGCHVEKVGELFDPKVLGVDDLRAVNFTAAVGGQQNNVVVAELLGRVKKRAYEEKGLTPEQQAVIERNRTAQWRLTKQYVARPLVGVWASAPYLHNGSVPTMDDLLRPAAERPRVFVTHHQEYDPIKMGYRSDDDGTGMMQLDTSIPGNRNTGHEYGVELSHEQRSELIEYLKQF